MRISARGARAGRTATVAVLVFAVLGGAAPAAQGSIWTGTCPVRVDFTFNSRMGSAVWLGHPSYSFSVGNLLGLPCAVSLDAFQPFRSTNGGGSGSSVIWTCESTLGSGSWNQTWSPSLPPVFGSHVITGTWGAWTMVVTSPSLNFSGVIELTTSPFDAAKLALCETNGMWSLSMWGTMVFQDPEIP